ncbi:SWPV1-089 [Shearwaterpox virus]|uniref:SWPV1-089 n=1 Tax=Shearwaterpox virus TaxID=1974596 RepID=A0A1V0S7U4_CNPV|nr:SWPV1-089 [Shearwaterpox virus]
MNYTRNCRRIVILVLLITLSLSEPVYEKNPESINKLLDTSRVIFSDINPEHVINKRDTSNTNHLSIGSNNKDEGIYLACESTTTWVANKTNVYDRNGVKKELVNEIYHNNKKYQQYLSETKCIEYPAISGCLGIDTRFWESYCSTSHSFVNAIVLNNGVASWDYIRMDTSCVCVVQMKCKNNTVSI